MLRKVDGKESIEAQRVSTLTDSVIKLKQVDHVNQERAILADVAGHPFITTLITTFSDHDSLYMLVGLSCYPYLSTWVVKDGYLHIALA